MFNKDSFFRRACGFRRPSHVDNAPPVPPLPASAAPADVPMFLSPGYQPAESSFFHKHHSQHHRSRFSRHVSTSSRASEVSSPWSTASSAASMLSFASTAASHESVSTTSTRHNPLRMNPASTEFVYDDATNTKTSKKHIPLRPILIVLPSDCEASDDDDDDDDLFFDDLSNSDEAEFSTVLSPPPHQLRLRSLHSEANLQQPARPVTPVTPVTEASNSTPASPVRPRTQSTEFSDIDRFMKRRDWKRRGIIFGAPDM